MVYKDNINNNNLSYIIQTFSLTNKQWQLNEDGLVLGVYEFEKKEINAYANCKTKNRIIYEDAFQYAIQQKYDDVLILNTFNKIVDSTIANIFIIKGKNIYTPPLSEGCIAGVMRHFMIERLSTSFSILETPLTIQDIEDADEIFLTNAIRGVQWIKMFKDKIYTNKITKKIFEQLRIVI